jgi:hypothetical protein
LEDSADSGLTAAGGGVHARGLAKDDVFQSIHESGRSVEESAASDTEWRRNAECASSRISFPRGYLTYSPLVASQSRYVFENQSNMEGTLESLPF